MMTPEDFYDLFVEELSHTPALHGYYKILEDPARVEFRKSYLMARWHYVLRRVREKPRLQMQRVWDFGCGYGTTALLLAMNGYQVHGTTVGVPADLIPKRKAYWSLFGDAELFTVSHEDLFDSAVPADFYDCVIVQDTLHHLEPIERGLERLHRALKRGGSLLVIEENGLCIPQRIKLYRIRGNKRIVTIDDTHTGKRMLMGNENIRGFHVWKDLLESTGYKVDSTSLQYIRVLPHFLCRHSRSSEVFSREQSLAKVSRLLRDYLYFGINFEATRI